MNDKSSYTKAEAKIHILYLVDRVPGVSYSLLRDSCMKSLYVDFFDFSDAYEELISGNLMDKSAADGNSESLRITDGGRAVLMDLVGAINNKLLSVLDTIAGDLAKKREEDSRIKCRRSPSPDGAGLDVVLKLNGDKVNSELKIRCDSDEDADRIMRNWRSSADKIMDSLIKELRSGTDHTNS